MWTLGLLAAALGQCFLMLAAVAFGGEGPLPSRPCTNCTNNQASGGSNLDLIKNQLSPGSQNIRQQIEIIRIKQRLESSILANRSQTFNPTRPTTANATSQKQTPAWKANMPSFISQKAIMRIIMRMRARYYSTARLIGYEQEVSEIITQASEADSRQEDEFTFSLKTNAPQDSEVQVLNANMFILVRCKKRSKNDRIPMIRIKLRLLQLKDDNNSLPLLWTTLEVEVRHTRWQKLVLPTSLIQASLKQAEKSIKFRIACQNCTGDIQPILIYKPSRRKNVNPEKERRGKGRKSRKSRKERKRKLHKRRPFIVVITRVMKVNSRSRRNAIPEQCLATLPRCQVKEFYVTFAQMGWERWVLSPAGFYANYCDGRCSSGSLVTRALVDDLSLSRMNLPSSTSSPLPFHQQQHHQCCVPTVRESLTLTQLTPDGTAVTTTVPGMLVRQCGCVRRSHQ